MAIVFSARSAPAQNAPVITGSDSSAAGQIRGKVINGASRTPVVGAAVEVVSAGAATATARTSTDADGAFRIEGLAPGRYRTRIRAVGYGPRELSAVDIASSSTSVDLATVELTAVAVELQQQVITGQRQDLQLAPDRNTYIIRDMPTTRGGTAIDVLRNVPGVDVDIDNVVSLRGNSGVIVQMNGRPSPLKPAQLGNFLAQLPADVVDKVEVIPNPSAREAPEGVAGIINIVLKQKTDAGIGGGATAGVGTTGQFNVGGNLGYQRGPVSLYGSYGFLRDNRPRTESIFRENRYLDPLTYLEEAGQRTRIPHAHTLTGSAGYKLGEHDELSADIVYSKRTQAESYGLLYRDLNAARDITGLSNRLTLGTQHQFNLESSLAYKHTFADKSHTLEAEANVVREQEGGPGSVSTDTLALSGTPIGSTDIENQTSWERPNENSIKVDYARPLSAVISLETGYKGSLQRFHTTLDTHVFDAARGAFVDDSTRISDFTYRQDVNAAYALLNGENGKLRFQGGVRVERAATKFDLTRTGATYRNDYNSLFPSALVAYDIDDARQVKLSFSTRIRRPDDTDLIDPTVHYADPLNVSRGNPYLKPEYIRAFELGLQRSGERMTIQLTPFFRHTIDAVRTIRTIDAAGVSTRTFANVATSNAYGTDATLAMTGGRLTGFLGMSAFRQVTNAANVEPGLNVKTFGLTARTNASYRVSNTVNLQTLISYQAPMLVEQGRNAARTQVSIAAQKKLMQDRMSLTFRLIDPFKTYRESFTMTDAQIFQISNRRSAVRGLLVSANWTFGKQQKKRGRDPNETIDTSGAP